LGFSVPSAVLICSHCGFVSQHPLRPLGLLPDTHRRTATNDD
jgi:hypothetical protein